jgi:hypothetical protein
MSDETMGISSGTYKKRTPPREKKADVLSGILKKREPMMIAWKTKELKERVSLVLSLEQEVLTMC